METAKRILDKYATKIIKKVSVYKNKEGVAQVKNDEQIDYKPSMSYKDIPLWIAPKNWIRLEFEDDHKDNERYIAECESALKSLGVDYCITGHGGKSDYINICNMYLF